MSRSMKENPFSAATIQTAIDHVFNLFGNLDGHILIYKKKAEFGI